MTSKRYRKRKNATQQGYLVWHWKNKHRQYKIPVYLAVNYKQNIGTEWDTASVNNGLGPYAHRALEEIGMCLSFFDSVTTGNLNPEHISSTNDDWSDLMKQAWSRWRLWNVLVAKEENVREATILFARGERLRAIEKKLRIRQGHGKARALIDTGIEKYAVLIRSDRIEHKSV